MMMKSIVAPEARAVRATTFSEYPVGKIRSGKLSSYWSVFAVFVEAVEKTATTRSFEPSLMRIATEREPGAVVGPVQARIRLTRVPVAAGVKLLALTALVPEPFVSCAEPRRGAPAKFG